MTSATAGPRAATDRGVGAAGDPSNPKALLRHGEALEASEGPLAAMDHYTGLLDDERVARWAGPRLLQLVERSPAPPVERAVALALAVARSGLDDKLRVALIERLAKRDDPGEAARIVAAVAPVAGLFRFEWRHAAGLAEAGEIEAAATALDRARAGGRLTSAARNLQVDLLGCLDRHDEATALAAEQVRERPDEPEGWRRLIASRQRARDYAGAADALDEALARWPDDWMLLFRLNRLPLPPDRLAAIVRRVAGRAAEAAARDDRYRLQYAMALLHVGEIDRAGELLAGDFAAPVDMIAKPLAKAVASRGADAWAGRGRVVDDRTREVLVARSPGAVATVVLTTGISFGNLPLPMVDALFAEQNVDVIYLRDLDGFTYRNGIAELGADEATTVRRLRAMLAETGNGHVIAMGSSLGGFAALRYGMLLEAAFAVSWSGPTDLAAVYDRSRPSIWNPQFFMHQRLLRHTGMATDLVPLIAGAGGRTRFLHIHGADAEEDVAQARRLEGLPNVRLVPVAGVADHFVVAHMIASGGFAALLARLADPRWKAE